jgi:hypothetical protein
VFMALTVALVHWLVFHLLAPRVGNEAWWHDNATAAMNLIRDRAHRKRGP